MKYKGELVNPKPYKVGSRTNANNNLTITLNFNTGVKLGDKLYQKRLDNGCILLIPEKLFNELEG